MKMHLVDTIKYILLSVLLISCFAAVAPAEEPITLSISPRVIHIGAQYDGTQLQVSGTVPAGSDVVLRFAGAPSDLHLREKGKIFGLLWMNVGKVTLKNVPKVCIVDSSRDFDKLGPAAIPFNLEGLVNNIEVEHDLTAETVDVKQELLQLKINEGLYSESELGITLSPDADGRRNFSAILPIPSALAPGEYTVETVAIRDGQVVGRTSSAITSEMIGFPRWLSNLAFGRSLLYGMMATAIALVSGLVIGLIFQGKGVH